MRAAFLSLALSVMAVQCQSTEQPWQAPGPNDSMFQNLTLRRFKGSQQLIRMYYQAGPRVPY